jgi:hypothetical protein
VTYELRRPAGREGVGPLEVFRAISPAPQARQQIPARYVASLDAYRALSANPAPEIAAALNTAKVDSVLKVWTELAYEAVRIRVRPTAPSRLESLFAFADPIEALSFTEETDAPKHVWRGQVEAGAPWVVVDMSGFSVPQPPAPNAAGFRTVWRQAETQAMNYWQPGAVVGIAEILVGGPILLSARLRLLPLLRELGLLR